MFRRHPILFIIGLILLGMGLLIAVFIVTFDLNSYREHLEQQISDTLQAPVSIADARLSIHQGLAFDFREVRIGEPDSELFLATDHLYLQLDILPLLRRKISISAAELAQPHVTIQAGTPQAQATNPLRVLDTFHIHKLKIRDGHFVLQTQPDREALLTLGQVQFELSSLDWLGPFHFSLETVLDQQDSEALVQIAGNLSPGPELLDWRQWQADVSAQIHHLELAALPLGIEMPRNLTGMADLDLDVSGMVSQGVHIQGGWRVENLQAGPDGREVPVEKCRITASMRKAESRWWLTFHHGSLDDWHLEGPLEISGGEQPPALKGRLAAPPFDLAKLLPLARIAWPQHSDDLQRYALHQGRVSMNDMTLDGPAEFEPKTWLAQDGTLRHLDLRFREVDADLPQGQIRHAEGRLVYADQTAELQSARLAWDGLNLSLNGTLSQVTADHPQIDLQVEASSAVDSIIRYLEKWPAKLRAEGAWSGRLNITGDVQAPKLNLQADLGATRLNWGEQLKKDRHTPAELSVNAQWQPPRLIIERAQAHLGPLNPSLSGILSLDDARAFEVRLDVPEIQLSRLVELAPQLEWAKLQGVLQGKLDLQGADGQITHQEGLFDLKDGGAHFAGIVGDLNQARGRIQLSGNRLSTSNLNARLGESLLQLDATIEDFRTPRLEIHLEGREVRPQDLIFPGEEGLFDSLDGRLVIDGEGIAFSPVDARTAGGTIARVTGAVHGFSNPWVELHIAAQYGNVDEILVFFQRPENDHPDRGEGRLLVLIEVEAERGHFRNIDFSQGRALIRYQNRKLDIAPLRADLDPGYYNGRVVWTGRDREVPLLIVSGAVHDADTEKLYRSQTQLRGLVSGTLRGSFYVQGESGNFWPSSHGGLNLEIKDGVLYRFPVLSKVFSLLNVSQIFTFRLPDMSLEGMPFKVLTADVLLHDGILGTENLFMDSNAMNLSLVGEVDLVSDTIDALLGVKPLRTVDKIVTRIPIAGWILAGEDQAVVTAHFKVQGPRGEPSVTPVPVTSLSESVFGIFRRVLGLPAKMVTDLEKVLGAGEGSEDP